MVEWRFWNSIDTAAEEEASRSTLSRHTDGPADAYRHLVGTGEMRRRFGWFVASRGAWLNEVRGTHVRGNSAVSREMDDFNNSLGLSLGADATTYADVVRRARAIIETGAGNSGAGLNGGARWLPDATAINGGQPPLIIPWPSAAPSATNYPYADERFTADRARLAGTPREREARLLERLEATPTEEWSEPDVRAVISSTPYLNTTASGHAEWRARVRQYFEERTTPDAARLPANEDSECGGVANVRAYSRRGVNGPVRVGAHQRGVSCG